MTTQPIPATRYDLVEIDARARQMRADMLTGAFRRLFASQRCAPGQAA